MTTLPLNAPLAPEAPATPQNFVVYSEVQRMPLSKGWSQFMLMCRCFTHPSDDKKPTPTSRSRTYDFTLTNRRTHSHLTNPQFHEQTVSFHSREPTNSFSQQTYGSLFLRTDGFMLTISPIHSPHELTDGCFIATDGFTFTNRQFTFTSRQTHSLRSDELIVTNNSSRWFVLS